MQNQMFFPVTDDVKQQTARHLYDQNEITVMDESMPSPGEIWSEETIVLPEIVSMPEYIRRHYAEEIIRTCREEINDAHLCVMYDGRYFRNVPGRTAADDGGELILTDGPAPGDWDAPRRLNWNTFAADIRPGDGSITWMRFRRISEYCVEADLTIEMDIHFRCGTRGGFMQIKQKYYTTAWFDFEDDLNAEFGNFTLKRRFDEPEGVPLDTEDEMYIIVPEEAAIVREIFTRHAHGETPNEILKDMIARRVPPPAGDRWQLHQIAGMLHNEKYTGDVVLQKNYIESHLTHREVRNKGEVPMYHIHNAHPAIIDRRLFAQAAAVTRMRKVRAGNSSYPYDTMLRCPHCGEILVHGALYPLYFGGRQLRNGGWGCYGPKGCRQFLMIQNVLDAAMLNAHEKKYGTRPEKVDYWWLDELVESITFHEDMVTVCWKDGDELTLEMNPPHPHYVPANAAARYNAYLEQIRSGEARTKCRFIMGL